MTLDLSLYPPAPVVWCLTALDAICQTTLPLLQCGDWRDRLGVQEGSWLSHKVGNIAESFPHLITFQEYRHMQLQDVVDTTSPTIPLGSSLYSYAFETPSTALADLTTPTAMLVLAILILIWRCIKMVCLPYFSNLGRIAGRRTHGAQWEENNQARIEKFGEYVLRLLFHLCISIYGVYYFWDKEWWKLPGGTVTLFKGYPYQRIEPGMGKSINLAYIARTKDVFVMDTRSHVVLIQKSGTTQFRAPTTWMPFYRYCKSVFR
jgi:hypothetical protein